MRLQEIDRGDSLGSRLLIGAISLASGMRLPDAARVAFYHKNFFGTPMGEWTHAAMRGASEWSVGERELMATLVARWNSCPFCVGAHGAVSAKELKQSVVDVALADYHVASISDRLKAT
jgi:AhpD family alkylhydroperoxidase